MLTNIAKDLHQSFFDHVTLPVTLKIVEFVDQKLVDEPSIHVQDLSEYEDQKAQVKKDQLWKNTLSDTSSGEWPNPLGLFSEGMLPSFKTPGDEMKSGRPKYIHSVGVVSKCKFNAVEGTPYSGIFKGADHGILRFSSATQPSSSQPLAPGMGLKFLRDGVPSANLVAMFSVNGQPDDWNFFSNTFVNHITPATSLKVKALEKKFSSATSFISEVGLSDFAAISQDGTQESEVVFPFSLKFEPTDEVKNLIPKEFQGDYDGYIKQLESVPADSTFYDVLALDKPTELGGTWSNIGTLQGDGKLTASKYGDEKLFFRHQFMNDDLAIESQWEKYTPKYGRDATKCPFASLY